MLRPSPRVLVLRAAALAVALLTSQMVAADLTALHRRARAAGPLVPVVVARHDVVLGATLGRADLDIRRVFRSDRPAGVISTPTDADGRVVVVPAVAGAPLFERQLAPRRRRGLDALVPPGMRAVRVAVGDGLAPSPGSVVDVLATFDPRSVADAEPPTLTVARGVLVIAAERPGADGHAAVILLVPVDIAPRVVFAATSGTLTLVLDPPEEAAAGD